MQTKTPLTVQRPLPIQACPLSFNATVCDHGRQSEVKIIDLISGNNRSLKVVSGLPVRIRDDHGETHLPLYAPGYQGSRVKLAQALVNHECILIRKRIAGVESVVVSKPLRFAVAARALGAASRAIDGLTGKVQWRRDLEKFVANPDNGPLESRQQVKQILSDARRMMQQQPSIHSLDLSGLGIKRLSAELFNGLKSIEHINLGQNELSELFDLSELQHLKSIDLRDNNITHLEPLTQLRNLTDLQLDNNPITNFDLLSSINHTVILNQFINWSAHQLSHDLREVAFYMSHNQFNRLRRDFVPKAIVPPGSQLHRALSMPEITQLGFIGEYGCSVTKAEALDQYSAAYGKAVQRVKQQVCLLENRPKASGEFKNQLYQLQEQYAQKAEPLKHIDLYSKPDGLRMKATQREVEIPQSLTLPVVAGIELMSLKYPSEYSKKHEYYEVAVNFANSMLGGRGGTAWHRDGYYAQEEIAFIECKGLADAAIFAHSQHQPIGLREQDELGEVLPNPILIDGTLKVGQITCFGAQARQIEDEYKRISHNSENSAITGNDEKYANNEYANDKADSLLNSFFKPSYQPRQVNWLCMAAPHLHSPAEAKNESTFQDLLTNAFEAFTLAKSVATEKGQALSVDTGPWGCGEFKNDRLVSLLAQVAASALAGVEAINFFYGYSQAEVETATSIYLQAMKKQNGKIMTLAEISQRLYKQARRKGWTA